MRRIQLLITVLGIVGLSRPAIAQNPSADERAAALKEQMRSVFARFEGAAADSGKRIRVLLDSLVTLTTELRSAAPENIKLRAENDSLKSRTAQSEKARRPVFTFWDKRFLWAALCIVIVCVLATAVILVTLFRKQRRKYYEALLEETVTTDDGKKHVLYYGGTVEATPDSRVYATKRRCPYCKKLIPSGEENEKAHLAKCPKYPRLTTH